MARMCSSCGKKSTKGASRSHSKIKTIKRQNINLQKIGGKLLCSTCARTMMKKA
ncbi:MAG TPA: 50S ribosomal protein L28 [Candidatus Magasanikbacteria bacterium]|nr:50S ribosomal protein L28 [Candidatus Magasanikbacteria bacterium]